MKRLLTILLIATAPAAWAHSWYDPVCCSDRDCYAIADTDVRFTAEGWQIVATGQVIPFSRTRVSADEHFHRCSVAGNPKNHTICLYAPAGGA